MWVAVGSWFPDGFVSLNEESRTRARAGAADRVFKNHRRQDIPPVILSMHADEAGKLKREMIKGPRAKGPGGPANGPSPSKARCCRTKKKP